MFSSILNILLWTDRQSSSSKLHLGCPCCAPLRSHPGAARKPAAQGKGFDHFYSIYEPARAQNRAYAGSTHSPRSGQAMLATFNTVQLRVLGHVGEQNLSRAARKPYVAPTGLALKFPPYPGFRYALPWANFLPRLRR